MNRVQFGEGDCDKTRKYLDSYISNELLVETNHEVLRHLESCPACSAELDTRAAATCRATQPQRKGSSSLADTSRELYDSTAGTARKRAV